MTSRIELTPPLGFSTLTPIPSSNELPPITVSTFTTTTLENTSLNNRVSTSANPDTMIFPTFVEANYEILESLLRERQKQICNEDLRTELEYFSKDYEEEREMEPIPCLTSGLPEDVENKTLQIILELHFFKSSLFDLCIHHSSNLFSNPSYQQSNHIVSDYSHHFQLAIYSGVVSPLATRKVHVHAINGFDMPLPVAVCSGLVNPLAPRKGKFHGGLITISTLCT
ncbi:hypothetical protein Tco_0134091 [Tanacetum coccineum]